MLGELQIVEKRRGGLNSEQYGPKPVKRYRFNEIRLFVHDITRLIERYQEVVFSIGTFTVFQKEKINEIELWRKIGDLFDCIDDTEHPFILWDAFDVRKEFLGMIG